MKKLFLYILLLSSFVFSSCEVLLDILSAPSNPNFVVYDANYKKVGEIDNQTVYDANYNKVGCIDNRNVLDINNKKVGDISDGKVYNSYYQLVGRVDGQKLYSKNYNVIGHTDVDSEILGGAGILLLLKY